VAAPEALLYFEVSRHRASNLRDGEMRNKEESRAGFIFSIL
jgi:hypothetical protein